MFPRRETPAPGARREIANEKCEHHSDSQRPMMNLTVPTKVTILVVRKPHEKNFELNIEIRTIRWAPVLQCCSIRSGTSRIFGNRDLARRQIAFAGIEETS
jgi:hypothetical protein